MMEERYHATTQNRFYSDMSNVNKNITVEAKLITPPTFFVNIHWDPKNLRSFFNIMVHDEGLMMTL